MVECDSAMSETEKMKAIPTSPQRHVVAGLAAVVGGLVAPYERASPINNRPVLNWLWASGHHPFGPFSNTSSVSYLLRDTAKVSSCLCMPFFFSSSSVGRIILRLRLMVRCHSVFPRFTLNFVVYQWGLCLNNVCLRDCTTVMV